MPSTSRFKAVLLELEALEERILLNGAPGIDEQAIQLFNASPAVFIENQGQWSDEAVRFVHNGSGANVIMTDAGPVFEVFRPSGDANNTDADAPFGADAREIEALRFSAAFLGADSVAPMGRTPSDTVFNYFVGDEATWREGVPGYEVVAYEGLYGGIDLHTFGQRDSLKYEFHVAPGADWAQIQVRYDGIEGLSLAEDGSLVVALGGDWGVLTDDAPYIYQEVGGERIDVAGRFALLDNRTYTFEILGEYDPSATLVIDPDLAWATYLGGTGEDWASDIALESAGNVFISGTTYSYPFTGGSNDLGATGTYRGAGDAFAAKLTASGEMVWATYMGGNAQDEGHGIAVDASGTYIYVTGLTESTFLSGPTYNGYRGNQDAFLARLTPTGGYNWMVYLGGSGYDAGFDVASYGSTAYVTGYTSSGNFSGGGNNLAMNNVFKGGYDAFVARVGSDGTMHWGTYLGGDSTEYGYSITVHPASGDVFLAGATYSSTFYGGVNNGAINNAHRGMYDAFAARLSSSGYQIWATHLGGTGDDFGYGLAVDATQNVFVTGQTGSASFTGGSNNAGTNNALKGGYDGFAAKLYNGQLTWATYLGGSGADSANGIVVDSNSNVYVAGTTQSDTFSAGSNNGAPDNSYAGGGDAFALKLTSVGALDWALYLGGSGSDTGAGIARDTAGSLYVTGLTYSNPFGAPANNSYRGGGDAYLAKLALLPVVGLDLQSTSDTGVSDTDNITRNATPTFDVTVNQAGELSLDWGDASSPTVEVLGAAGTYSYAAPGYGWDGAFTVTVTFTVAGIGQDTEALPVTIDTTPPNAPDGPDLQAGSDTGVSATDNTTNDTTPTIDITGFGEYYRLYRDGLLLGDSYATDSTYTEPFLGHGTYTYSLRAVDAAGNESAWAEALNLIIDTIAPSAPNVPDLQTASDSGISNTDGITNNATPTLDLAGYETCYRLYRDGTQISGDYATTPSYIDGPPADGTYEYTITSVDAAGNESAPSGALAVTVDTTAPDAPPAPDLNNAASDPDGDDITADDTPTFDVVVPADHYFRLYRGGELVSAAPILGDDGAIYRAGTQETLAQQPQGDHLFTATVVDAAGNESAQSPQRDVRIAGLTEVIATHLYDDGVRVTLYDTDSPHDTSAPNIAWTPAEYARGVTDIYVVPGWIGDGMINAIYLLGDGSRTEDIGILVEREGLAISGATPTYLPTVLRSFSDGRSGTPPLGFLAVLGGDLTYANFAHGLKGGLLNGLVTPAGSTLPADLDGDAVQDDATALLVSGATGTVVIHREQAGDLVLQGNAGTVISYAGLTGDVAVGGDLTLLQAINRGGVGIGGDVTVGGHATRVYSFGHIAGSLSFGAGLDLLYMAGNLTGDLDVTGNLGSAILNGNVSGAVNVTGSATQILVIGGQVTNDITVGGDLRILKVIGDAPVVLDGDVTIGGSAALIYVRGGDFLGDLTVGNTLGSFLLYHGDFEGLLKTNTGGATTIMVVNGSMTNNSPVVDIAGGLNVLKVVVQGGNAITGDVSVGGALNLFYVLGGDVNGALTAGSIGRAYYFGPGGVTGSVNSDGDLGMLYSRSGPVAGNVTVQGHASTIYGLGGISGTLDIGNGLDTLYSVGAFTGNTTIRNGNLARLTVVNRGGNAMFGNVVDVQNGQLTVATLIGDYTDASIMADTLHVVKVVGHAEGVPGEDFIRARDENSRFYFWHDAHFHVVTRDDNAICNDLEACVGVA